MRRLKQHCISTCLAQWHRHQLRRTSAALTAALCLSRHSFVPKDIDIRMAASPAHLRGACRATHSQDQGTKRAKEQITLEAEQFVTAEFQYTRTTFEKSTSAAYCFMKVLNMAGERLELEALLCPYPAAAKEMIILLQAATVVKVKSTD